MSAEEASWPVHFTVSDAQLAAFGRRVQKPKDCFINALELTGAVSSTAADILRILAGDDGIDFDKMAQVFVLTFGRCKVFKSYPVSLPECRAQVESIVAGLPVQRMLFAGFTFREDANHIVMIAKTAASALLFIDPQQPQPFRDLREVFGAAKVVYILSSGSEGAPSCPRDTCLPRPALSMGSEQLREELRRMQHEAEQDAPPAMSQDRLQRLQVLLKREKGAEANVDADRVRWFVAYLKRRLQHSSPSYSGESSSPPPPYTRSLVRSRSRPRQATVFPSSSSSSSSLASSSSRSSSRSPPRAPLRSWRLPPPLAAPAAAPQRPVTP
jgi:hypothetical protein